MMRIAMKTAIKVTAIVLGAVTIGIVALVADFLRHGGQFRPLAPATSSDCRTIELAASAEDIQIDDMRKLALLSYLDRRARISDPQITGTIMLLDLSSAAPRPRAALSFDPPDFRPHGLSLYQPPDAAARLFAISHPAADEHRVELFEQTPGGSYSPLATIEDPLFHHPNAIAALGPRQFYIANDSGARNWLDRAQELLFRRGLSTIVYYTGDSARIVDQRLRSVAGIALSADLTRLYAAETMGKALRVYKRDLATGAIELLESVPLDGAPDNLNVAADGSVWISVHPRSLALVRHFMNADKLAPSMIVRYDPAAAERERVSTVYVNHGEAISAASVAAAYDDHFAIGSITDHKVLLCERP